MNDEDLWATDTGLFSDYEGVITDAWFTNAANNQAPQLHLKFKTDVDGHEEQEERYNLGPDWSTTDGGETMAHPTAKRVNRGSQAGILIDRVAELVPDIREKGSPLDHKTWLGMRFFMEAVTRSGEFRDRPGEKWTSTKNFPTRYLGDADVSAEAVKPTGLQALPIEQMNQIQDLANSLTHAEWVDKVLEVPGVLGNDALISALPDSSPDGLYERLKAK